MKKVTLILLFLLIFTLCACASETQQETIAPSPAPATDPVVEAEESVAMIHTNATEAEATVPPTESEETIPAASEPEIPKSPIIKTKYYTLTLPDEWKETCFYSVVDDVTVTLREKDSYEAFGGGKLCTVMLMPTDDETYTDFPDYELLCALDTPEGSFYAVALFPTDVQFNEDTADAYNAMADSIMDVVYTIQPVDGIAMTMPAPVLP